MSVLNDLKPVKKLLVMDLLEEAGVDVSDWKNYKGMSAAANPKYCYNWSFEQPGEVIVLCLWYGSLKESKGAVTFHRRYKGYATAPHERGANVWNRRDAAFGSDIEKAYRQQLPIRVIIVDGEPRNPKEASPKTSLVNARMLDPVEWAASEINGASGDFLLVRGVKPLASAVEAPDVELAGFEGQIRTAFVNHRRRESKMRRAKIDDAKNMTGGKLTCEVPNCGFNFVERYGELGKNYAQVHHLLPLCKSPNKGREVKLSDLAIVCANCHAMIHRGGACRPLNGLIR